MSPASPSSDASTGILVRNSAPQLSDLQASAGRDTTLRGSMTDSGSGDSFTLLVDWSDGSSDLYAYAASNTGFSETHRYATAGGYDIAPCVLDDDGCASCRSLTASVSDALPAAALAGVSESSQRGSDEPEPDRVELQVLGVSASGVTAAPNAPVTMGEGAATPPPEETTSPAASENAHSATVANAADRINLAWLSGLDSERAIAARTLLARHTTSPPLTPLGGSPG